MLIHLLARFTHHLQPLQMDSKWLGSGGVFGLAKDEDGASIRVLREEEVRKARVIEATPTLPKRSNPNAPPNQTNSSPSLALFARLRGDKNELRRGSFQGKAGEEDKRVVSCEENRGR
jgi:hypothetical protein